jgi:hypothetical protein
MHSILPSTRGKVASGDSDMIRTEMAQKNAGLWIQYSALSLGRSCGTELLDNGGIATVLPARVTAAPRNTAHRNKEERTKGGDIVNMQEIFPERNEPSRQCTSRKDQKIPFPEFDEKERAYTFQSTAGIHVLKNECPGKKRNMYTRDI